MRRCSALFVFCPELSEAPIQGTSGGFCVPVAQGNSKACLSGLEEGLQQCYSLGPGVTAILVLGRDVTSGDGATCFPVLVMDEWMKYRGPGEQLSVAGHLDPRNVYAGALYLVGS